jgi:nitrogen fixation NifU-like protein
MTDDLYREIILDHFRHPRNHGKVPDPDVTVEGVNPLCGDQITLTLKMADGRVAAVRTEGKGCSISQSSASMMTEALMGKTPSACRDAVAAFKGVMLEGKSSDDLPDGMEDLSALEGVKKYPTRIKCALLGWNTVLQGLDQVEGKSPGSL